MGCLQDKDLPPPAAQAGGGGGGGGGGGSGQKLGAVESPRKSSVASSSGGGGAKERGRAGSDEMGQYKVLLLGSGESGKSTFFKQMLINYGHGYEEEDRVEFVESIYENTIESMKTLIAETAVRDEKSWNKILNQDDELADAADLVENLEEGSSISRKVAAAISLLWEEEMIQNTFDVRSNFQVPDSAEYFFNEVSRLAGKGYIPSEQDLLRCRDRTTGVTHETLRLEAPNEATFEIYDVGGQRSERRAWVQIFQNVNAVIFVVAISEFDQFCFEDDATNRLEDALAVFDMIINSKHFEDTPICLMFNKMDLFVEKLEAGHKFQFDDGTDDVYDGDPSDPDDISEYVRHIFEKRNRGDKAIITTFLCALDETFNQLDEVLKIVVEENT